MVKLPLTLVNTIPLAAPLLETLVKDTVSGVVELDRVIWTAIPVVVVIAPLVIVMVLLLSVASKPRWPESGVMVSAPKVIVPVLVSRLIPVVPDPVTLVVAKLKAALEVLTLSPMPVGFVMVVEPLDILPPTLVKVMPVKELLVDEMLVNA